VSFFKAIGRLFGVEKSKQPNAVKANPVDKAKRTSISNRANKNINHISKENISLVTELNKCRQTIARREGIKPYMVFSDRQLHAIVEAKPINERELSWIEGFDEDTAIKYGKEITKIFRY